MTELDTMSGPQAASLAGLAPLTKASGTWKGRKFVQGGRDKVRGMLYMPTVAAIRGNPTLGRKYEALLIAAEPPRVAITAVMRKLLVLAASSSSRTACGARHLPPPRLMAVPNP